MLDINFVKKQKFLSNNLIKVSHLIFIFETWTSASFSQDAFNPFMYKSHHLGYISNLIFKNHSMQTSWGETHVQYKSPVLITKAYLYLQYVLAHSRTGICRHKVLLTHLAAASDKFLRVHRQFCTSL